MPMANDPARLILNETVLDFDLLYAPAYATFIMVYTLDIPDNTFYWRFLQHQTPNKTDVTDGGFHPPWWPYEPGANYAEAIVNGTYAWSDQQVLYTVPTPAAGAIYAGGVHQGYFDEAPGGDIATGGWNMLLSWTEHTGQDPTSDATGYYHKTAVVTFK